MKCKEFSEAYRSYLRKAIGPAATADLVAVRVGESRAVAGAGLYTACQCLEPSNGSR
jgi:hypothetical protein